MGSLRHCATTLMGFTLGSPAGVAVAARVLAPLVACGLDEACVTPPGSSRANHRQEQTALNAILCALSHGGGGGGAGGGWNASAAQATAATAAAAAATAGNATILAPPPELSAAHLCTEDRRYSLTSDTENRNDPLQPTANPADWNALFFYTRRRHPVKPYLPYLELRM